MILALRSSGRAMLCSASILSRSAIKAETVAKADLDKMLAEHSIALPEDIKAETVAKADLDKMLAEHSIALPE
eukprot:CAMPEP_0118855944 /NCGR_PEP_ID=MMETSP1163-20130328/3595_1 /TAXON_ID=124430 /ORGANISM="Phaeomonas parva, Strain CCMP2877" /LENGTH=72 /DNA_ID=CAMNT_0006788939 /DNA_START=1 /DNA_END=216 /DNA_ORIENTATION=-